MRFRVEIFIAAVATVAASMPVFAETLATATTPLNIRSGPGPQYSVIGAIPLRARTTIIGCIQGSLWCQVSYNGRQGWAYAQYMTARLSGRSLAVAESLSTIPTVQYREPIETVGSAVTAPTITGTLVVPRSVTGEPLVIVPPPPVSTYVVNHPVAPIYLNGEVVEGVALPENVALAPVPGFAYNYAYINNVPVLVEPTTREVRYIYR